MSNEKLSEEFKRFGFPLDDNILESCVILCKRYDLSEALFVDSWLAFSIQNCGMPVTPTLDLLPLFESKELVLMNSDQNEKCGSEKRKVSTIREDDEHTPKRRAHDRRERMNDNSLTPKSHTPQSTPSSKLQCSSQLQQASSPHVSNGDERIAVSNHPANYEFLFSNSNDLPATIVDGSILCEHGQSQVNWKGSHDVNELKFQISNSFDEDINNGWLTMNDLFLKSVMYDQIYCDEVGDRLLELNSLDQPSSYSTISEEPCLYVGRIKNLEGPCNPSDFVLEEIWGNYQKVHVDITGVTEYSIFPGQIVAIKGINNGKRIVATDVYTNSSGPVQPPPQLKRPIQIMAAAGPFSPPGNLDFSVLFNLVEHVKMNKPDILFLIGPFVDAHNIQTSSQPINCSFEELNMKIMDFFTDRLTGSKTKICYITSFKDASYIPVYPTPAQALFSSCDLDDIYPDPTIFNINGLYCGISSTDILMNLSQCETSNIKSNRIARLCQHLLHQQSFYPLYPNSIDIPLDSSSNCTYSRIKSIPHILITPSAMQRFIKFSDGCLFINPERCIRGKGSYFTKIEVRPKEESETQWSADNHVTIQICRV